MAEESPVIPAPTKRKPDLDVRPPPVRPVAATVRSPLSTGDGWRERRDGRGRGETLTVILR